MAHVIQGVKFNIIKHSHPFGVGQRVWHVPRFGDAECCTVVSMSGVMALVDFGNRRTYVPLSRLRDGLQISMFNE